MNNTVAQQDSLLRGSPKKGFCSVAVTLTCTFVVIPIIIVSWMGTAVAFHFYQQPSIWYAPIPDNARVNPRSSDYIQDILYNAPYFNLSYKEWGVPIYYSSSSTPYTAVQIISENNSVRNYILSHRWNMVPIPAGATPAGNTASCAGQYRDGHMVVVSADSTASWEFFGAKVCNGVWSAITVRKWDLTGDGINAPYDMHGLLRAASVPLTHGTLTYDEVSNNTIDHALDFCYSAEKYFTNGYQTIYPSGGYRQGVSTRTWSLLIGMRVQLDPTLDCDSLNLTAGGKSICRALQQYGMFFVDNCGAGNNDIFAEANRDWASLVGDISAIPIERMRVIATPGLRDRYFSGK